MSILAHFEQSNNCRKAIECTKNKKLIYTVGKSKQKEPILADREFIFLLPEYNEVL